VKYDIQVDWFVIVFCTVSIILVVVFIFIGGVKIEERMSLRGEQQVGIVIIHENQFRFEGQELFKTATKQMNLNKYEHIIVDGVDYFILHEF
jgi:hypothetical protein